MNNPQAKAKTNLTSVMPAVAPPESPEYDTKTPIDVSVVPFTGVDLPKWGPWLFSRLQEHWKIFGPMNYAGILTHHMADNHSLMIRSKFAIILAVLNRETFDPQPWVDLVFCFKHHPDRQEEDKDVRLLLRRTEEWARSHGAQGIRILHPEHNDLSPGRTKEALSAEDVRFIVKGYAN